jgi:hypothetical protein
MPIETVFGKPCQALNDQPKQCSKTCTKKRTHEGICSGGGPHA